MKNDFREFVDDEYLLHDAIDGDGFIDDDYLMHWKWQKHKYLYIDANGNYVYPEDVNSVATSGMRRMNRRNRDYIRYQNKMKEADAWNNSLKGKVRNAYEDVKLNAQGIANEAGQKIRNSKLYRKLQKYIMKRKLQKKYNNVMDQAAANKAKQKEIDRFTTESKRIANQQKIYAQQSKASKAGQKYYDKGSSAYKNEQSRIIGRQLKAKYESDAKRYAQQQNASKAGQKYYDKGSSAYKNEQSRIKSNSAKQTMNSTIANGQKTAYAKKKADEMMRKAMNVKTGKSISDYYKKMAEMYENQYNPNKRKKKKKGKVG